MEKVDFFVKQQIFSNLQDVTALINTGVFDAQVLRPFQEPVFVSLIIKLNDLLQKLCKLSHRVNFTEDISHGDVTDLVNKIRNAICHIDSDENILDKGSQLKFVFNMVIGKLNVIAIGDDVKASSDYDDDVAFFYGTHRIYLKRHIIRTLQEVQKKINELYSD